ncbi:hypothetical protein OUZ56_024054 [Daphnia magna]|uniref:Uncharacterized protein n=1 Tax=Daphnia magna TaxID=35525 RepID=A0ABR0B023_9CRUS|nr:hypothetical protein OUZ56_024054 [Daphnia magna]
MPKSPEKPIEEGIDSPIQRESKEEDINLQSVDAIFVFWMPGVSFYFLEIIQWCVYLELMPQSRLRPSKVGLGSLGGHARWSQARHILGNLGSAEASA